MHILKNMYLMIGDGFQMVQYGEGNGYIFSPTSNFYGIILVSFYLNQGVLTTLIKSSFKS